MTPSPQAGAPERASPAEAAGLTLLGTLPPALLGRILARCPVVRFGAGDLILRRGDANSTLHFLLAGEVHILFDLEERSRPIPVTPGKMFGEMSVIDELPVSAHVVAAQPSQVLLVPADIFWDEVVAIPGMARTVMRTLSGMLRKNNAVLTEALRERLRHEALTRELALAREIQMGMLRHADPWFPGQRAFVIAAGTEPARQVGGDFYDAFLLDPGRLVVTIGDVAGKGISAALFMVRALTLLRGTAAGWTSLPAAVGQVNSVLVAENDAAMFATLFMAVLDLGSGAMEYANCGHPPPLLAVPGEAPRLLAAAPSSVLGVLPRPRITTGRLGLPRGATLLTYTDGVTEAPDPAGVLFGEAGLLAAAAAAKMPADPASLLAQVSEAVAQHGGGAEQADDLTLLALRWLGS